MKQFAAYILLSLHVASAALGNSGLFSFENNTQFDASPWASYIIESYTFCMLKCLEDGACIGYNYNTNSFQCDLLKRISGILNVGEGYTSGIRKSKSVTVFNLLKRSKFFNIRKNRLK